MADHYQDHDLVNFQIQNMSDSEVPNTLRIRFSLVTINITFGFVGKEGNINLLWNITVTPAWSWSGLMMFSSQSWLSSLSSELTISSTELHLHLVSPLLAPARLLLYRRC